MPPHTQMYYQTRKSRTACLPPKIIYDSWLSQARHFWTLRCGSSPGSPITQGCGREAVMRSRHVQTNDHRAWQLRHVGTGNLSRLAQRSLDLVRQSVLGVRSGKLTGTGTGTDASCGFPERRQSSRRRSQPPQHRSAPRGAAANSGSSAAPQPKSLFKRDSQRRKWFRRNIKQV